MSLQTDFRDLLEAFAAEDVAYLLIEGYAVAFHAEPRFTKDLGLWLEDTTENLERVRRALESFGAPPEVVQGIADASGLDVVWMGRPPARVDMMKATPGGDFSDAFGRRVEVQWDGVPVRIVSREDLIALKRASGRPVDLLDVERLERPREARR
ncbi:MAG: hypothetical protein JNJ59_23805 [Deltaproteobacteria bacterium]|nr:hypothetical protein [Deltaproteobacteria bacterium]